MKILVLDFETTGPDPLTCRPIEVAHIVYDTQTRERSSAFSSLIWRPQDEPISAEIEELTGITQEALETEDSVSPGQLQAAINHSLGNADILCAYNSDFDRVVLEKMYESLGLSKPFRNKNWFCAMADLPWPEKLMRCRKLQHRALDLGLPMDTRVKHRAMADVITVCDIFDLYDMEEVLAYHAIPWQYVAATIPKPWTDGGKGRDAAKEAGFGWEGAPGDSKKIPGKWVRRFKEGSDIPEFPFKTESL